MVQPRWLTVTDMHVPDTGSFVSFDPYESPFSVKKLVISTGCSSHRHDDPRVSPQVCIPLKKLSRDGISSEGTDGRLEPPPVGPQAYVASENLPHKG
jgi:hypothetical protein